MWRIVMSDENEKIYKEVERIKQKAEELSLPGKVWDLYEAIKYYPSWKATNSDIVCNALGEVYEVGKEGIRLTYEGTQYELHKRGESGSYEDVFWSYIYLTLKIKGKAVFEIKMTDRNSGNFSSWAMPKWELSEIVTYLDGDWVEPIIKLSEEINRFNAERERIKKQREEAERLKQLKKNFGTA